jgi:hypothetical protein
MSCPKNIVQLLCVVFLLVGSIPPHADQSHLATPLTEVEMGLQRSACKGECPVYEVTLDGNGHVLFVGHANVRVIGEREYEIPKEHMLSLLNEFLRVRFFELRDTYRRRHFAEIEDDSILEFSEVVSDLAEVSLSLRIGGRQKTVRATFNFPDDLKALTRKFESTVEIDKLVGVNRSNDSER